VETEDTNSGGVLAKDLYYLQSSPYILLAVVHALSEAFRYGTALVACGFVHNLIGEFYCSCVLHELADFLFGVDGFPLSCLPSPSGAQIQIIKVKFTEAVLHNL